MIRAVVQQPEARRSDLQARVRCTRYAICKIKQAAAFLLPFGLRTITTQQSVFVHHMLSSDLGRVISCIDPCLRGFPQS
jgi:hypothetical protein